MLAFYVLSWCDGCRCSGLFRAGVTCGVIIYYILYIHYYILYYILYILYIILYSSLLLIYSSFIIHSIRVGTYIYLFILFQYPII